MSDVRRGNAFLDPRRKSAAPAVEIAQVVPHRSGQMRAFLSVATASGFVFNGCRLMAGPRGRWIAMPSRLLVDRDGQPKLDANGRQTYSQVIEFRDRSTADRFCGLVLEALRRQHPDLLDGDGP
jgi:DNA-binding cell septation regulator SpoVG